jgi:hypothetical protein
MMVHMMKEVILSSSSVFQIGGQEGHRTQEHLFTVRSIVARETEVGRGVIFQLYDIQKFFDKENLRDVMDTLHQVGVHPKLYRSWFNLNKQTSIKVNTAVGLSESAQAGELIGQGSAGGAIASQINIDKGLDAYFKGSSDEICYGSIRLQPLAFQDDIARLTNDVKKAGAGNVKIDYIMKEKQLQVHPDKTGYIVMGCKEYRDQVLKEAREMPIMFGGLVTKKKTVDKYLGDMFHGDGLEASVDATIDDRIGKIKASMYEVAAIVDDFRMLAVGGITSAWDLWNLAVVPSILSI